MAKPGFFTLAIIGLIGMVLIGGVEFLLYWVILPVAVPDGGVRLIVSIILFIPMLAVIGFLALWAVRIGTRRRIA